MEEGFGLMDGIELGDRLGCTEEEGACEGSLVVGNCDGTSDGLRLGTEVGTCEMEGT